MNTLQLSWLRSYILHLLIASFRWMRNIQAAAKVNVFWLNLKKRWPFFFFCKKPSKQLNTILKNLRELLGVGIYCPFSCYNKTVWAPLQISAENDNDRHYKGSIPHSLRAFVVRRSPEAAGVSWAHRKPIFQFKLRFPSALKWNDLCIFPRILQPRSH